MRIFIASILSLLLSCSPTLSGRVALDSGEPIVTTDGKINITSLNSKEAHSIVINIDKDGKWSSDFDFKSDDILIEALVPGYGLFSKKLKTKEANNLVVILKKTSQNSTQPIGVNLDGDVARGSGGATLTPPKL